MSYDCKKCGWFNDEGKCIKLEDVICPKLTEKSPQNLPKADAYFLLGEVAPIEFLGYDEYYGKWYKCPACGNEDVRDKVNYCDNCGVKFNWRNFA